VGGGLYYFMSEPEPSANAAPATTETSAPPVAASSVETTEQPTDVPTPATTQTPRRTAALGAKQAAPATATATATTADPTAPKEPAEPAPSAEPAKSGQAGLAPIDVAGTQAKVDARAASAAVQCAKLKSPENTTESFSGANGFRPDGSTSHFFKGVGGSRSCVYGLMTSMSIGKYAHPQEWHVETFKYSVTVK